MFKDTHLTTNGSKFETLALSINNKIMIMITIMLIYTIITRSCCQLFLNRFAAAILLGKEVLDWAVFHSQAHILQPHLPLPFSNLSHSFHTAVSMAAPAL